MANATRFPKGLSTFAQRHVLNTYPIATSPSQISFSEDFIPYRAADYQVTNTNGTVTSLNFPSGAIKLATAGSTAADAIQITRNGGGALTTGMPYAFLPGTQLWANFRVAYPRTVLNANDTTIVVGLNNAISGIGTNAIYFNKPSGGTAINLVIKQNGTVTTIQNIGDYALPSGLFGDAQSLNGILSSTIAGGAFTGVTVNTPGAGYGVPPLVLSTATAAGTVGSIPVWAGLGSAAFAANTGNQVFSTGLPYASLFAPFINNPGSGFTNAGPLTTLLEVEPWLDLSIYWDGKNSIDIGINGRIVLSITSTGITNLAAGGTINNATQASASYFCTTNLAVGVSPVAQLAGTALGLLPQGALAPTIIVTNTTANARSFYASEIDMAVEYL